MEAAGLSLDKQPFIFSEIVQELVHSFTLSVQEKNIRIRCANCENNSWIAADIHMMERVVQNLLINAVKYTPQNGSILVELENQAGDLVFRITNQSESIAPGIMEWLNDNDAESFNMRPQNHGLGLVIVKKILQLHRFPLTVGFQRGAGNIISFRMPVNNPVLSRT
jgi:signal transduction histidine kinase